MKITRLRLLIGLLVGCLGVWLLLVGHEWLSREPPNYTRIEPRLYLGGFVGRPPRGTTAVLSLSQSPDPYECEEHLWEPIRDAPPAPDLDWLRRMVEFIDKRHAAGATVFVHCDAGVSRSGMVVVAYEMFKHDWSRDEALEFVRSQRPEVRPNPAFIERLREWEEWLKEQADSESPRD